MAGLDWERERRDRPRRERGSDPIHGPDGSPSSHRKPAPKQKVNAETARLREKFAALPYEEQLAYLTVVKRSLNRLLRDEGAIAEVVKTQFKPLLKAGGAWRPPRPPPRTAIASSPPPPPWRHLSEEAMRLIRQRPGTLSPKQCIRALKEGTCRQYAVAEIKATIRHLRARGAVVSDNHGRLRPA